MHVLMHENDSMLYILQLLIFIRVIFTIIITVCPTYFGCVPCVQGGCAFYAMDNGTTTCVDPETKVIGVYDFYVFPPDVEACGDSKTTTYRPELECDDGLGWMISTIILIRE